MLVVRLLIPLPKHCPNSRKPDNLFGALRTETVQVRILKATTYTLFLVTLGAASVNAQAPSPAQTEARSPLSEIAHDVSTWFTRTTGTDTRRHREGSLPAPSLKPLPRPRPTDLTSVPVAPSTNPSKPTTAPVSSNKQPSELTTETVPPNKELPELTTATVPPNKEPPELTTQTVPPNKEPPELTSQTVPPNKEPSELTTETVPPNKEPSELTAAPVAPKKKPAPVLIND